MGRRLRTRLDMLHPCLSAKRERKSKHLPQPSPCNFEIGDPVMVKDYRQRKDPWIRGVIQMRLSPITYRVQVGDLFWKRHVDQLRSLAGSRVADVISPLPDVMSPLSVRPTPFVTKEVGVTMSSNEGQPSEPSEPSSTLPITQKTNPPPLAQQLSSTVTKEPDPMLIILSLGGVLIILCYVNFV